MENVFGDTFIADGAYDGDPVSKAVLSLQPDAQVIVPPHKNAVCSPAGDSPQDNPIQVIDPYGRIDWQKKPTLAWASAVVPDRMTRLGIPMSVKI